MGSINVAKHIREARSGSIASINLIAIDIVAWKDIAGFIANIIKIEAWSFGRAGVGAKRQPCHDAPQKGNPLGLVFQIDRWLSYNQAIIARFVGSAEMLTFAYARARSALDSIIHQLNLYHND